ncbi:SDR family NAD(P)-dependent oxidoreductase [Streptomyces sp. NBC_01363]|uniref:SDR family NAD(P)-dependent oxidoreductase n=1 Tax=Streptomyces sp. NBC_01363 TaxID=2903840 RepID=UPI002255AF52|nr:SDR family NAD(P)-dependent oxidoreductase [Streptomyces sp. NBC_01363]MCX4733890.1 SDR family NAD(P)-dependent oxidoreductase [Streptomyces sp. NBC_01363]
MDILVSNAGAYPRRPWAETTPAHWDDALAANLTSHYLLAQELTPAMTAAGWGRIITIGSVLATAGRHDLADTSAPGPASKDSPAPSPADSAPPASPPTASPPAPSASPRTPSSRTWRP